MHLIVILLLGLATAFNCSYYIVDAKHGRSIVAGDRYDGHIYHQDPTGRPNGKWVLEPVSGQSGVFFIRDTKHNNTLWQETIMMDVYTTNFLTIAQMLSGD